MLSSSSRSFRLVGNRAGYVSQRLLSSEAGGKSASAGIWCNISGFSPFVHRSDLQVVLSNFQPIAIAPLLDRQLYPNGRYMLQFKTMEEIQQLKQHIQQQYPKQYFVSTDAMAKQVKTSDYGITNKTVRITGIPENVGFTKLHLAYFLEDHLVDKLPPATSGSGKNKQIEVVSNIRLEDTLNIRPVPITPAGRIQYFVDLVSEQEAERLVSEKGSAMIDGAEISMFHYQT